MIIATGRNASGTSFAVTVYFQVLVPHIGVNFGIQMRREDGADYSDVIIVAASFLASSIGGLPNE